MAEADKPADPAASEMRNQQLAASRGAVEGLPIVGPYIASGVEHLAAGLRAPFTDKSYDEELAGIQDRVKRSTEANPGVTQIGNAVGGVVGSLPMVMAAPALFGAGGGSLAARTAASAASGTIVGGLDSGVRSDFDPEAMKWGAGAGLATGAVGPIAGQAIGAGVRKVANALINRGAAKAAGVAPSALSKLNEAAGRDSLDAAGMRMRLDELGPNAMIMDLGPNLQRQGGALASMPGRSQEIVRSAVDQRQLGANQRILGELDDTLGPVRSPVQLNEGIRDGQRATGPAYLQSFQDSSPVQTDYIARSLDDQVRTLRGPAQRAAQQVRGMLNETGRDNLDTNPYTLFQTRNAIDGLMTGEDNPQVMRVLAQARDQIDENLSRNVPGIKMADAQYEELARQNAGLNRGAQILESGKTSPRPEDLANEIHEGVNPRGLMVGPSGETFRISQGARAEIDRIVGTKANDIVGLNQVLKGEGDWNRAKLATLFGQDRADRIIDVLDREKTFANTRHIVGQNSETSARDSAKADLAVGVPNGDLRNSFQFGGVTGVGRSAAMKAYDRIANRLLNGGAETRNESLAGALTDNRQAIIDALMRVQQPSRVPTSQINQVARGLLMGGGLDASR
jgi:hypothetical protein